MARNVIMNSKNGRMVKTDIHLVSVIVPARQDSKNVTRCREALVCQTRKPDEVIVVVDSDLRGASWARNDGIRRAKGNLIAFVDDDCLPPDNWLETLIEAIDRYDADGAGGPYEETDPFLGEWRRRQDFPEVEQLDETGLVGFGGNLIFRRSCLEHLEKLDGYIFNEAFQHASEDWELTWRLRAQGARLIFVPLKVKHQKKVTLSSYLSGQFQRGMGVAMLFWSYRAAGVGLGMNKSLLWGEGRKNGSRWLQVVWLKGIGPFDWRSFSRVSYFIRFWLGEKSQSVGFLWGIFRKTISCYI